MTEAELLGLAQSAFDQIGQLFAQVVTVNFAMAAAIFYFLHEARMAMKVFAFAIYAGGMLMYVGFIAVETRIWDAAVTALQALPQAEISAPGRTMIALTDSWLLGATAMFLNFGFLVLGAGSAFLLFFWRKDAHLPKVNEPRVDKNA